MHGFPRILGVMTHLDQFRENKQMKKMKKTLKHRFWQETHDGAKMFHLSGMLHGRYPDREIINLARFISCARAPTLKWRQSHPYMLALRWEDLTRDRLRRLSVLCLASFSARVCVPVCSFRSWNHIHRIEALRKRDTDTRRQFQNPICPLGIQSRTLRRTATATTAMS